jgi:hypothetical protein
MEASHPRGIWSDYNLLIVGQKQMTRIPMPSLLLRRCAAVLVCGSLLAAAPGAQESPQMPTLAELQKMTARYAPADVGADISALPP